MKVSKIRSALSVTAVTALLGAGLAPTAWASGAGDGNFTCNMTGIPGIGHVTSSYYHPTRYHYATAIGVTGSKHYATAKHTATSTVPRAVSGNKCYWGF